MLNKLDIDSKIDRRIIHEITGSEFTNDDFYEDFGNGMSDRIFQHATKLGKIYSQASQDITMHDTHTPLIESK
jgi:hypothetical protein